MEKEELISIIWALNEEIERIENNKDSDKDKVMKIYNNGVIKGLNESKKIIEQYVL